MIISTSHRTGEPSVTGRSVGAALVLSSVFALIGWLFLRQSAAESALISAALGLATVSIYFVSQRNRSRNQAADLKHVTEALRESEERFRDFATVSSDWFWEQDADHRFSYVSSTFAARYIGAFPWDLPGDVTGKDEWAAHRKLLAARLPFRDFRYERVGKDGRLRCFSISGRPRFGVSRAFLGYRGTGRDITEQVEAEKALRSAKEGAETASHTKSQILANMSHELRTPLNAIIGFSDVISQGLMGPVDARYREYASDIFTAGSHLLKLITDVLDLSKIESGHLKLYEEPVNLVSVIDACHRLVVDRARDAFVRVEKAIPPNVPLILGDELRLKQIVLNLLSNAVKFTALGGTGGRVRVELKLTNAGVTVSVSDTGVGMKPEDIPVALAPFRQLDDAFNRRYEGTGLGLPLAKMLTELHGGVLEITSAIGLGTTVNVHLPRGRILSSGNVGDVAGDKVSQSA
jgi:PAS domain S-box-containing protein